MPKQKTVKRRKPEYSYGDKRNRDKKPMTMDQAIVAMKKSY